MDWLHPRPPWVGRNSLARGWLQKLNIKGILLLPFPLFILPAALPQPATWTSFCKHTQARVPGSHLVPDRAEGGPTPYSRMNLLPPPLLHPGEALATGDPWCSLAGHTVLSFKSLFLMWFHITLCQRHEGRVWLVCLHTPLAQCLVCVYHVPGTAPCMLTQVSLPVSSMGGSASFRKRETEALQD